MSRGCFSFLFFFPRLARVEGEAENPSDNGSVARPLRGGKADHECFMLTRYGARGNSVVDR